MHILSLPLLPALPQLLGVVRPLTKPNSNNHQPPTNNKQQTTTRCPPSCPPSAPVSLLVCWWHWGSWGTSRDQSGLHRYLWRLELDAFSRLCVVDPRCNAYTSACCLFARKGGRAGRVNFFVHSTRNTNNSPQTNLPTTHPLPPLFRPTTLYRPPPRCVTAWPARSPPPLCCLLRV